MARIDHGGDCGRSDHLLHPTGSDGKTDHVRAVFRMVLCRQFAAGRCQSARLGEHGERIDGTRELQMVADAHHATADQHPRPRRLTAHALQHKQGWRLVVQGIGQREAFPAAYLRHGVQAQRLFGQPGDPTLLARRQRRPPGLRRYSFTSRHWPLTSMSPSARSHSPRLVMIIRHAFVDIGRFGAVLGPELVEQ